MDSKKNQPKTWNEVETDRKRNLGHFILELSYGM